MAQEILYYGAAMDAEFEKVTQGPAGEIREEWSISVDGTTLSWSHWTAQETLEGEEDFATESKALEAANKLIAERKANGFVPEDDDEGPPKTPDAPSDAKEVATRPAWLETLPDALVKQHKKLSNRAKKHTLSHRFAEIEAAMRPGIDFRLKKAKASDLKSVVTRIGGAPDLLTDQVWPSHGGAPLTFVGQIVITDEIKSYDIEGILPAGGLLSFFAQLDPHREDYGELGSVLHVGNTEGLVQTAAAAAIHMIAKAGLLKPKPRLSVAPGETPVVQELELNDDETDNYDDELFRFPIPEGRLHSLLGWADTTTHHDLNGKRFLAQFDSDHRVDFQMGDYQALRFYIDGDVLNDATLKTVVCTLSSSDG